MNDRARRDRARSLLREVLGTDAPLLADARLCDVGLDSLAFVEFAAALEDELDVDVRTASLQPSDRVEDLLRVVDAAGRPAGRPALPRATGVIQGPVDALAGWALRRWLSIDVVGEDHLPATGPAIVAMNHESALDIPVVVAAAPRRIVFMAKKELFKNPLVSAALRSLGAFRVDRGRFDLTAVHAALEALERGEVVGMYPEGTRSPGRLLPFLHGSAWLALRTGVPLVPCSISGTELTARASFPGRVRVRVGFHRAILVERTDDPAARRRRAAALTLRLRTAIASGLRDAPVGTTPPDGELDGPREHRRASGRSHRR